MAAVGRFLGLCLAVTALERQAERYFSLELRSDFVQQREDRLRRSGNSLHVAGRECRELGRRATEVHLQRRRQQRRGCCCSSGVASIGFRAERIEIATGVTQRAPDLVVRRSTAPGLPQVVAPSALQFQEPGALLCGRRSGGCGLARRRAGRKNGEDAKHRDGGEHDRALHGVQYRPASFWTRIPGSSLEMKRPATPFFRRDVRDRFGEVPAVATKVLRIVLALAIGVVCRLGEGDGSMLPRTLAVTLRILDADLNDMCVVRGDRALRDGEAAVSGFHLDAVIRDTQADTKAERL